MESTIFSKYLQSAQRIDPIKCAGKVIKVHGLLIESLGPSAIIGEICRIIAPKSGGEIKAEVVGLKNEIVQLMAFHETYGIEIGDRVIATGNCLEVPVCDNLLGRVLDAFGNPIDGKGDIDAVAMYPALANAPDPLKRKRITERITTGIKAIDGLLATGKGQRHGIFAGSGVGKSTLLGMIARYTTADVNVVALIGERGREVNDFIEYDIGAEGLKRTVLIVTTSNTPPLARLRGAYVATAVAEYFRDQGLNVMLLFDSVTRVARAIREIGLATGEFPAQRGFPPSMFDSLPKLLERSGTSDKGSITGFYTILVDGDDLEEPVSDTVRGILDGHINLSRDLAQASHYPPIDILSSISRLAPKIAGSSSQKAAGIIRRNMAAYSRSEVLINVGAYRPGTNPETDQAIAMHNPIEDFLLQDMNEASSLEDTLTWMSEITGIEIPQDEMSDENPKLASAVSSLRTEKLPKKANDNTGGAAEADQVAMAINSVSSFFGSFANSENINEEV